MPDVPSPFRIAGRLVDPSLNRVVLPSGETVQVEPKIMQVLTALSATPGVVVSRDELMARVWNGVFVTDDALHRAIRELRRVFDDDAERPAVIETIRKRGYRLIAPIQPLPDHPDLPDLPAHPALPARPALPAVPGLVALPVALLVLAIGITAVIWLSVKRTPPVTSAARVRFMPLTSEPGNEVDPALSASGRLAYVARGDDGRSHIFTKSSGDAAAVQITRGDAADHAPVWSPDESRLAFVRMTERDCSIWIAAADGREARTLIPCRSTDELKMSWSPDGQQLAVTANADTERLPSHIELVAVADGAHRAISEPPRSITGDWAPAFSPDGRSIAFVRSLNGSTADLFVAPADATGVASARRITTDNADVLGVDWEPDGGHLIFSSDRAGGIGLWRVALDGGPPAFVAGGGSAKLKHPSIARTTGIVAYEEWQYEINLREQATAPSDGDQPSPVSPTADRWNFHPQLSPDGRRLAFQSTRSGQYELWLADRDGSNARPLTRSGVYKSPARWSPDGDRLAFTARFETRTDLIVLTVDDHAVRTVVSDATNVVAPAWSADGSSLYFGSLRTGDWQIWNVDLATGAVRQVTTHGGYAALESPNRQWLYVARLDRRGLWRRPIDGGPSAPETLAAARVQADQWPNWGFFDRGIYYVTWPDDGDPALAIVADGANNPRLLTRLPEYAWPGIALSHDATRLIYARADRRAANIGALRLSP